MLMNANGDECRSGGGGGEKREGQIALSSSALTPAPLCRALSPRLGDVRGKQSINVMGAVCHPREA